MTKVAVFCYCLCKTTITLSNYDIINSYRRYKGDIRKIVPWEYYRLIRWYCLRSTRVSCIYYSSGLCHFAAAVHATYIKWKTAKVHAMLINQWTGVYLIGCITLGYGSKIQCLNCWKYGRFNPFCFRMYSLKLNI